MNKNIFLTSILISGILAVSVMTKSVVAQTGDQVTPEISFPVVELGNCADKIACKAYCDKPEKIDACLIFAEKNKMMSDEEIKTAKNFKKSGMIGPGECKGKDECKTYCNDTEHMGECISFAEKNGLMSGKKLEEAKKVKGAITKGIKPPACGDKEACDVYCSSSNHVEECVKFGEAAGTINKDDAKKIRNNGGKKGTGGQGQGQGQNQNGQQGQGGLGNQGPGGGNGGGGQGNGGGGQQDSGQGGQGGQGQNGPEGQQGGQGPNKQQGTGQGNGGGGQGNGGGGQGLKTR